jgi:hypothetical protein
MMWEEGRIRLEALGKTNPILHQAPGEAIPAIIRAMAEETGKEASLPMAEAFHVRGLGVLNHIEDLAGEI